MSGTQLTLTLRPGVRALTSVLSVLHARAAEIDSMDYRCGDGSASMLVHLRGTEAAAALLAAQIGRRIDVTHITVGGR